MRLLVLLVRSMAISHGGTSTKSKPRQRARSSKSVRPFLLVPGTNQPPFMLACGRTEQTPPFASRSGQDRVGAGFVFASLGARFQKDMLSVALNWCTEVVGGTCTLQSKRRSATQSK